MIRYLKSIFDNILVKNLIKNSSQLFIAEIFGYGIALIQGIIIARFLNASGYGLLTLVVVYVTIVNQIVDFRIREAVVKYASEYFINKDRQRLWATLKLCYLIDLSTGILAFIIVVVTARIASTYLLHAPAAATLITLYALTLLFSTVDGTSYGVLTVLDKFSWISVYSAVSAVIKLLCVVLFVLTGTGIKRVLFAYVLASLICSALLSFLAMKLIKAQVWYKGIKASIGLLRERGREIASFLFNTNVNESLSLIIRNADALILGFFRPAQEVGYYRMAKNIAECFYLLNVPLYTAIYPQLSKMWAANKRKELVDFIKRVSIFVTVLVVPPALALYLAIPWLINVLLGAGFMQSALAVRIMLVGVLIPTIFLWIRPIFLSMGKPGTLTAINMFNAVTMLILSVFVVSRWGYVGSSVMYVYPYLFGHALALYAASRAMRGAR